MFINQTPYSIRELNCLVTVPRDILSINSFNKTKTEMNILAPLPRPFYQWNQWLKKLQVPFATYRSFFYINTFTIVTFIVTELTIIIIITIITQIFQLIGVITIWVKRSNQCFCVWDASACFSLSLQTFSYSFSFFLKKHLLGLSLYEFILVWLYYKL
jgi:hypothetical protein